MFQPPRCPYPRCPAYRSPAPDFCRPHGAYRAACRPAPIPRFRCKSCRRTFSRQTFRMDYADHRPDRNAALFLLLASGVGLRQSARNLKLSRRCTELKARKIGRHLRRANLNLRGPLAPGSSFQLDELETYEARRNTRPLTVPVLIEAKSRFIVWAESAPIPPSGRMSPARRAAIAADEARFGRRPDGSRASVARTLRRGQALAAKLAALRIDTDEKSIYPGVIAQVFTKTKVQHERTNSRIARGTWNPLFAINHTEAIARDLMGRLRRESWLASKLRRWLDVALHVFLAYRNYVRRRVNHEEPTPAQELGFVPRAMTAEELLSWRQDGGQRSIHPLAKSSESIADFARAQAPAA